MAFLFLQPGLIYLGFKLLYVINIQIYQEGNLINKLFRKTALKINIKAIKI